MQAIINLVRGLNLKVVAEGVDSTQQLELLQQLRCDEIQGFLFSKPLPPAEAAKLLRGERQLDYRIRT